MTLTLDRSTQSVIAETAARLGPAVVGLGRGWGHGSGVVVAEGRVLTNAHNVRQDEVSVVFFDGRRAAGSKHITPLFRESDRKSMSFVFDLWS